MPFAFRRTNALVLGLIALASCEGTPPGNGDSCPTEGTSTAVATVSYAADIVPLLTTAGCLTSACHGGTVPSSRYDLRTYASAFIPGDDAERIGACEIVPGEPENSFLFEKLQSADPRVGLQMPLERDPLSAEELDLIETWIREGAQDN